MPPARPPRHVDPAGGDLTDGRGLRCTGGAALRGGAARRRSRRSAHRDVDAGASGDRRVRGGRQIAPGTGLRPDRAEPEPARRHPGDRSRRAGRAGRRLGGSRHRPQHLHRPGRVVRREHRPRLRPGLQRPAPVDHRPAMGGDQTSALLDRRGSRSGVVGHRRGVGLPSVARAAAAPPGRPRGEHRARGVLGRGQVAATRFRGRGAARARRRHPVRSTARPGAAVDHAVTAARRHRIPRAPQ